MGIMTFFADREHNAQLRESKDEMFMGEVVRALAHVGWPAIAFEVREGDDWLRVRFKALTDPVFSSLYITLDRKSEAKAALSITVEVRNYASSPARLARLHGKKLIALQEESWEGLEVSHEFNAIHATHKQTVVLDDHVNKGEAGRKVLAKLIGDEVNAMREKLRPYHRSVVSL